MVSVIAVTGFNDKELGGYRQAGDVFEVTKERLVVLSGDNHLKLKAVSVLDDLTTSQLKDWLDKKGIAYDNKAKKADLISLFEGDDDRTAG